MDVTTLMSLLQQQQAQGGTPPETQVPEAPPPQTQQEPPGPSQPQIAPQIAQQTDNAPDMRGAPQQAPQQPERDPIQYFKDLQQQFEARQKERQDPNYLDNMLRKTLGTRDQYAQEQLDKRIKGKGGTAKALLIDFLTGGNNQGDGIRTVIKKKAENDYATAAKELIGREQSERADSLQQLNLAHQEALAKHQANQEELRRKDIERKSYYQGVSAKIAQQNADTTAGRKAIQNELDKVKTFNAENGINTDFGQQLAIMTEAAGGDQEAGLKNLLKLKANNSAPKNPIEMASAMNAMSDEQKSSYLANLNKLYKAKPVSSASGGVIQLSPEAKQMYADALNAGKPLPSFGRNGQDKIAEISNIAAGKGKPPDMASAAANFKADVGSLNNQRKMLDNIESFENTAKGNIATFKKTAADIRDTGSPLFNTPLRAWDKYIAGTPEMAKYETARHVALTEFARVVNTASANGVLSDSAKKQADELIKSGASLKALLGVTDIMERDMDTRKKSAYDQINKIQGRIGNKKSETNNAPSAPTQQWGLDAKGNPVRLNKAAK